MKPIEVKKAHRNIPLPAKMSHGSGGFDIFAVKDSIVPPSKITKNNRVKIGRKLIGTGLYLSIPRGYVGKIGSRSGLSASKNIEIGAGWIDSDFRGEILIEIKNFNDSPFKIKKGDRFAQIFFVKVLDLPLKQVSKLSSTKRGGKGLGSTG